MLAALGVAMEAHRPPDDVEEVLLGGRPVDSAVENARRKLDGWRRSPEGRAAFARAGSAVAIGVDTIVVHEGRLMGKPAHRAEAEDHMRHLAGATHEVVSAVAAASAPDGPLEVDTARTRVRFRPIGDEEIAWYLDAAAWHDKAGSYGIQEHAGLFVEGIEGCYFNVVGLPLHVLGGLLRRFGFDWPSLVGRRNPEHRGNPV